MDIMNILHRLISKDQRKRQMQREASTAAFITLHSFITRQGYLIDFVARISSNRLMYSVIAHYQFNDASMLDDEDFDKVFRYYIEAISALSSITAAEGVKKMRQTFLDQANYLLSDISECRIRYNNTPVQKKKSFLGLSEEF